MSAVVVGRLRDAFAAMPAAAAGRHLRGPDRPLLIALGFLVTMGVVMVYSASVATAVRETGSSLHYFLRHAVWLTLGFGVGAWIVFATRVAWWEKMAPWFLLGGMAALMLVLVPGVGARINGATRWIALGPLKFQPAEFMKIVTVVYVAGYLVRRRDNLASFGKGVVSVGLLVGAVGGLIALERDLGSVVVIGATVLAMLLMGGMRKLHFAGIALAGVAATVALILVAPYRVQRVVTFLDPWADPFNSGFQLTQSLIAFGRGEWIGVGLGASVQKLSYLPMAHTDFILAVIGEELGVLGVALLAVAFLVILARAFTIARRAEALGMSFGAHLAAGIGVLFAVQGLINMCVSLGMVPTKGLTLPFVSYGGSSLLANCMGAALLLRVDREIRARSWEAV